jgi:hypothetical protein
MYVLLPGHMMDVGQVCTLSALHIISNECKSENSRHKSNAPDLHFVYKKVHQRPIYLNKYGSKI